MQGITTFFVFSSCVGSALQKYLTFNHVYNIYKYLQYIQIPAIYTNIYNIQGVSKKTSFCQNWPGQILLLIMRNPLRKVIMGRLLRIQPSGRHATLLVLVSVHCLVGLDSNETGSFSKDAVTRRKQRSKQLSTIITSK